MQIHKHKQTDTTSTCVLHFLKKVRKQPNTNKLTAAQTSAVFYEKEMNTAVAFVACSLLIMFIKLQNLLKCQFRSSRPARHFVVNECLVVFACLYYISAHCPCFSVLSFSVSVVGLVKLIKLTDKIRDIPTLKSLQINEIAVVCVAALCV